MSVMKSLPALLILTLCATTTHAEPFDGHGAGKAAGRRATENDAGYDALANEVEIELQKLQKEVFAFGNMKVSRDKTVTDAQTAIFIKIRDLKAKLRTVIDCRAMLKGKTYPDSLMGAVAHMNNIVAMGRNRVATSSQGFFTDSFTLFDDVDALIVAFAYPGMPLGQLPAKSNGNFLEFSGYKTGVAAVYNPYTCTVETSSGYKTGVAGVYNPKTGKVEWSSGYQTGVAGAYNPLTGKVEWSSAYKSGVAAAFDANRGVVVSETAYKTGVAVTKDPRTGTPEFQTAYKSGIAGYRDSNGKMRSITSYKSGLVLLSLDPKNPTLESASFGSDYGDDDD